VAAFAGLLLASLAPETMAMSENADTPDTMLLCHFNEGKGPVFDIPGAPKGAKLTVECTWSGSYSD
jgi:hypothetical protein